MAADKTQPGTWQPPANTKPPVEPPLFNDPATPGTPTGVEHPDGGGYYQPGDDYQYYDPYYDESGLQTGVGGKLNERVNVGIDPKLIDYTNKIYENSPYANRNYNVNAQQADAFTREAQENEMSAYHLEQMLGSDSPLMQRARSQAMAGAGGRGLMNSSIAQGAAMGSMIDRAQPFALQDASSHGRAASESLAARNQASLTNAQLGTQAGIAGMQAGASRDQQLLASELGGRQDLLRHALGMETREDQQKWQSEENQLQMGWQGDQNQMDRDFQDSQNRLQEQFQWADNRQSAVERWAEGEFSIIQQRASTREQALSQIAASIFGNPELTAAEQNAAWASAQRKMADLYGKEEEYTPGGPTWTDPGYPGAAPDEPTTSAVSDPDYKAPVMAASAQGAATKPRISQQNTQLNKATGQVYNSPSSPNAAMITEALPPII